MPDEIVLTSRDISGWESIPHFTTDEWSQRIVSAMYSQDESRMLGYVRDFLKLARQQHPLTCRHVIVMLLRQCVEAIKGNISDESLAMLTEAMEEVTSAASYQRMETESHIFLSRCYQAVTAGEQERGALHNQRIAQQVCAYVHRNYTDPNLSLQNAADETALSASYLGRIFKQSTGQSFGEYLTECRLEAAKDLLKDSGKTVAAIAEAVGLENPSYFSTLFKKAYNMSPKVFRETEMARKSGNSSEPPT
jgi:two-component system response regulator YesN